MRFLANCLRPAAVLFFCGLLSACVTTHHRTQAELVRAEKPPTILVLPVDAELSELSLGGFPTPRQDWTAAAREHMYVAIRRSLEEKAIAAAFRTDDIEDETTAKLMRLHAAVGHSIMHHQYEGPAKLPTKEGAFDWTLGPVVREIARRHSADYMLVVHVRDSYAGPGRVAAQVVVAALFGVSLQGGMQVGFASLVDLKTGNVVWFNRLQRGTGDLRTEAPARETVQALLTGMPQ